jgi:hypothetical protein
MIFYLDINPHPEIINVGACTIGGVAIPLSGSQNLLTQRQERIDALRNQIIAKGEYEQSSHNDNNNENNKTANGVSNYWTCQTET